MKIAWLNNRTISYIKALGSGYTMFILNIAASLVAIPFFLRYLGVEIYGVWSIMVQLIYIVSSATFWISVPVTHQAAVAHTGMNKSQAKELFQTVFWYYSFLGAAGILIAAISGRVFTAFFKVNCLSQADVNVCLILLSLYMCIIMQQNLLESFFIGSHRMHLSNIFFGAVPLLATLTGVIMLLNGFGITGLAFGHLASAGLIYSVTLYLLSRKQDLGWRWGNFKLKLLIRLLSSGLTYLGYDISYQIISSDVLLIGCLLGPKAAAVYAVAYKIVYYFNQVIFRISKSLLPIIAELDILGDTRGLFRLGRLSSKISLACAFSFAISLCVYGYPALIIWVGQVNAVPAKVLFFLSLTTVLQAWIYPHMMLLYSTNNMKSVAGIFIIEAISKVFLALAFLPGLGLMGAALATIISQVLLTFWYVPSAASMITGDRFWISFRAGLSSTFKPAMLSVILGGGLFFLLKSPYARVFIGIPAMVITYLIIFIRYGLSSQERSWIGKKLEAGIHSAFSTF